MISNLVLQALLTHPVSAISVTPPPYIRERRLFIAFCTGVGCAPADRQDSCTVGASNLCIALRSAAVMMACAGVRSATAGGRKCSCLWEAVLLVGVGCQAAVAKILHMQHKILHDIHHYDPRKCKYWFSN